MSRLAYVLSDILEGHRTGKEAPIRQAGTNEGGNLTDKDNSYEEEGPPNLKGRGGEDDKEDRWVKGVEIWESALHQALHYNTAFGNALAEEETSVRIQV